MPPPDGRAAAVVRAAKVDSSDRYLWHHETRSAQASSPAGSPPPKGVGDFPVAMPRRVVSSRRPSKVSASTDFLPRSVKLRREGEEWRERGEGARSASAG